MLDSAVKKASSKYPFGADDFFQQVIGSVILTAPLLFTEEIWRIAADTSYLRSVAAVLVTLSLGHGILYVSKRERDWDQERKILGVTLRYLSLMGVSFGTITFFVLLTGITETFNAGYLLTAKVISLISIFAVIGAATADNLI